MRIAVWTAGEGYLTPFSARSPRQFHGNHRQSRFGLSCALIDVDPFGNPSLGNLYRCLVGPLETAIVDAKVPINLWIEDQRIQDKGDCRVPVFFRGNLNAGKRHRLASLACTVGNKNAAAVEASYAHILHG